MFHQWLVSSNFVAGRLPVNDKTDGAYMVGVTSRTVDGAEYTIHLSDPVIRVVALVS